MAVPTRSKLECNTLLTPDSVTYHSDFTGIYRSLRYHYVIDHLVKKIISFNKIVLHLVCPVVRTGMYSNYVDCSLIKILKLLHGEHLSIMCYISLHS